MSGARARLLEPRELAPYAVSLVDAADVAEQEERDVESAQACSVHGDSLATGDHPADAAAAMTLAPVNLRRAREIGAAFECADENSDVRERLLLELVASESAIALELQDVEGGLVALLGRTITDPMLATAVAKTLREVVGVSNAIRRRMENSLSVAEDLKAQRRFTHARRGKIGV